MAPQTHNVVASFEDRRVAQRAAEDLSRRGLPSSHVRIVRSGALRDRARVGEFRDEMQDEVSGSFASPAVGLMTGEQAQGAVPGALLGTALGLLVGAGLGAGWAYLGDSPISEIGRFAIAAVCCMFAGATIGFVAGGAMKPRLEAAKQPGEMLDEKRLDAEATTIVAVERVGPEEAELAHAVLEGAGATRVSAVDADDEPLPPQSEHPRPADPPGYWADGGRGKG
jgi:hypothetical protein